MENHLSSDQVVAAPAGVEGGERRVAALLRLGEEAQGGEHVGHVGVRVELRLGAAHAVVAGRREVGEAGVAERAAADGRRRPGV